MVSRIEVIEPSTGTINDCTGSIAAHVDVSGDGKQRFDSHLPIQCRDRLACTLSRTNIKSVHSTITEELTGRSVFTTRQKCPNTWVTHSTAPGESKLPRRAVRFADPVRDTRCRQSAAAADPHTMLESRSSKLNINVAAVSFGSRKRVQPAWRQDVVTQ